MGNYTWEGHLEAEQAKKEAAIAEAKIAETTMPEKNENIIHRIIQWFKKLFHKDNAQKGNQDTK